MATVAFQDVEVDRCETCKGIFFDAGEQNKLKGAKGATTVDVGDVAEGRKWNKIEDIDCPKCKTKMIKMVDVDQHHIWYESCPVCKGAFFDAGEFTDFAKYTLMDYMKGLFNKERK
jgi:Zn-finger nucleic acid-binding protein